MSSAAEQGLIVGVGQSARQDDGVGPYVAEGLRTQGLPAVAYEGEGSGLLDLWAGRPVCIAIDAIADPADTGRIRLFTDFESAAFSRAAFVHSSHQIGLPEAIALGRSLGQLPVRLIVIGIAGSAFGFGHGLSPAVAEAAERLIERLCRIEDLSQPDMLATLRLE